MPAWTSGQGRGDYVHNAGHDEDDEDDEDDDAGGGD